MLLQQARNLKSILLQWYEDTDNTAIDFPFKAYEDEEFEPLPSELHPMLTLYDFSCCVGTSMLGDNWLVEYQQRFIPSVASLSTNNPNILFIDTQLWTFLRRYKEDTHSPKI